MILQSLVKYYEVLAGDGKVPRRGWSVAKVSAALRISADGDLLGIVPLSEKKQVGKKTVEGPQMKRVPEQVARTVAIAPNFLCDNSGYILGIDAKGKPERSKKCFEAAKQLHLKILDGVDSREAAAVRAFFEKWEPETAESLKIISDNLTEIYKASNLIFEIDGRYAQEDEKIEAAWTEYHSSVISDVTGRCLVTGKNTVIAKTHGMIKGIPGAQSSGASLVGFNAPSFCSYGKTQSYNAPVGEQAVYAYTTALNYLISNRESHTRLGDTMIVYWPENGEEIYQQTLNWIYDPNGDNIDIVRGVFNNLYKNWAVDVDGVMHSLSPDERFYILGLSPNAARLSVRFFYADSFGNIIKHLKDHYDCMEIIRPSADPREYLGTWQMMQEIVNKKSKEKKPPENISGNTFRAMLSGGRYPEGLYMAVLRRIQSEQDDADNHSYKITRGRAAIIKAYLIRNKKEDITVALNEESTNVPYTLGRIFSVLEWVQERSADGKINSTIKDRYFNSACATPASVFPILLKLKNNHMKKIGREHRGSEIMFEQLLGDLQSRIPVDETDGNGYPKRLNLEEQGMFILGYYHQTQKRFQKKNEEEK